LANREWRLAQEMACDELALRLTGQGPAEYGAALMEVAASNSKGGQSFAAAGFDDSPNDLKRRLKAMQHYSQPSARKAILGLLAAVIVGTAVLIPWRVVAQTPQGKTETRSASSDTQNNLSDQRVILQKLKSLEAQVRALNAKLGQERFRGAADRKREVELLQKARSAEMYASQMDRAKRELQIRDEQVRMRQLLERDQALKESEAARSRAENDARQKAELQALNEQLSAEHARSADELKHAEELYRTGNMSQSDLERIIRQQEHHRQRLQADLDKASAIRSLDQNRYQLEQLRLLDMAKAKINHRTADKQQSQAEQARLKALIQQQNQQQAEEMARMKDLIKRQEQQILELERRNKEIQDKRKGKQQDQALLNYRIANSNAQLGRLRARYSESDPAIRQALYESEFLAQLNRSKDRQDKPTR